jgi:hypothetical protein
MVLINSNLKLSQKIELYIIFKVAKSSGLMLKYNSNIHVLIWLSKGALAKRSLYSCTKSIITVSVTRCLNQFCFSVSIQLQIATMLACSINKLLCVIPLTMIQ